MSEDMNEQLLSINEQIDMVVELMKQCDRIVVITGAGMSTGSGIPDFRSDNGLYSKYPTNVLSRDYFYNKTDLFYEAFNEKFSAIINAKPNEGHNILAKWQNEGRVGKIITQNIDNLHTSAIENLTISEEQKTALIENVLEIHGTIKTFTVKARGRKHFFKLEDVLKEDGTIEYRRAIDGLPGKYLVKPDVVLFGEPIQRFSKAIEEVTKRADFMLVLGTSLQVYPFAYLPTYMRRGKYVVVVNKTPVDLRREHTIMIQGDITDVLKQIDWKLRQS